MGRNSADDPCMAKVRRLIDASGMTRQQIGEKMGYSPASARQAITQLLRARNPQIATLRRLAKAIGVRLNSLV